MLSPFMQAMRSRWFGFGVHLGLWCLLYLAVSHLGGKTPEFRINDSSTAPPPGPVPVGKMDALFSPTQWPLPRGGNNVLNPFLTSYFVPVPSPAPPAPTTRKIAVTYQGYYEAGDDIRHAVVKVDDLFVVASIGAPIATNLFVAGASVQNLVLTNLAAQTNLLPLNSKKEIEIPIK